MKEGPKVDQRVEREKGGKNMHGEMWGQQEPIARKGAIWIRYMESGGVRLLYGRRM